MKEDTRQYFDLVEEKALPPETRNYVPKFIAALYLGENPDRFGFRVESKPAHDFLTASSVRVPAGIKLLDIAKETNCSRKKLVLANPHLRRQIIHSKLRVEVFIPNSCYQTSINLASLKKLGKNRLSKLRKKRQFYRVRRGDSLLRIARLHGTSVRQIKRVNRLRSNRIYPGQKLRLSGKRWLTHKVRRGESLYLIAKKYQTTISKIKKVNRLRRSRIYPGQVIKIALAAGKQKVYI